MATIVGVTALDLSKAKKAELCDKVAHGMVEAFHLDFNISMMMLLPILPCECHGPSVADSITYFIHTGPGKPDDQKRQVIKNVYDATVEVVGPLPKNKVIVIFKEHADNNVGVDGVMRVDAKANGTFNGWPQGHKEN